MLISTLTTALGEIKDGTVDNDTFNVVLGAGQTLNSFDEAHGGAGTGDVMNIESDGTTAVPASAEIDGIETIRWSFSANPATAIDAGDFVGSTRIEMSGYGAAVDNINGQTIAVSGAAIEATDVLTTDGATTLNVELDGVDASSTVAVDGDVTTLNISGSVGTTGELVVETVAADLETLTLALTSDSSINVDDFAGETAFTTINAAASTGDLSISTNSVGDNSISSVAVGTGNDTVYIDMDYSGNGDGGDVGIVLGAGDDDLSLALYGAGSNTDNAAATVTLGAGSDLVTVTETFTNVVDASEAAFEGAITSITDFDVGDDTIDVSIGSAQVVLTNVQLADIADEANLFDAVTLAATTGGASATIVFEFDDNTYVLNNDATAGFSAGDGLIELVGVSVNELNAANFVV